MDNTRPDWLPEEVSTDGDWAEVLALLHGIFTSDFVEGHLAFEGRPVWWDRRKTDGVHEETFWHLITRDEYAVHERLFDTQRARRLPWCAPTVSNSADGLVLVWDYKEGSGRIRTYLWLYERDYCVILEKRPQRLGEIAFLVTAYHIDGERKRRDLLSRHAKREGQNAIAATD